MYFEVREINFANFHERWQYYNLLISKNIFLDFDAESYLSLGLFFDNEIIVAASFHENIVKGFVVRDGFEKLNFASFLLEEIIKRITSKGFDKNFVYVPIKFRQYFERIGYRFISHGKNTILLEYGENGLEQYLNKLNFLKTKKENDLIKGSIVVNGNPFTLGHRDIIEKAASECDILYVFVIKDDKSFLSNPTRKRLIIEGTKDIKNVRVIGGSDYLFSKATFSVFFKRKINKRIMNQIINQIYHDVYIFGRYIAPALGVSKRFTGYEEFDELTNLYNQIMTQELKEVGIETIEIERKKIGGKYISATKVRNSLKLSKNWEDYLPKSTISFLESNEGKKFINLCSEL